VVRTPRFADQRHIGRRKTVKAPFLLFGSTAEAMRLYQSCLRGDLKVTLLRDTPMEDQAPDSD
jgi:hypothetical protein